MNTNELVAKVKFYKDLAESGMPYDPPPYFYNSVLEAIINLTMENNKLQKHAEDLRKQINTLRKAY